MNDSKFHNKRSFITQRRIKSGKIKNEKIYGTLTTGGVQKKKKYNGGNAKYRRSLCLRYREADEVVL